jgi:type II secretory pathway pseudopilin PulG
MEAVLVTGVLGAMAALALPALSGYQTSDMREKSRKEMLRVAEALEKYFEDVGAFPPTLLGLKVEPAGVTGWKGPYIPIEFTNATASLDSFSHDHFRQSYIYSVVSTTHALLRSRGENRTDDAGTGDDLQMEVDATPILRSWTAAELRDLNLIVDRYNQANLPFLPLTEGFADCAFLELQNAGYFPANQAAIDKYEMDAWGQKYKTQGSPVFEIWSEGPP